MIVRCLLRSLIAIALGLRFIASAQSTTEVQVTSAGQSQTIVINHSAPSAVNRPPIVVLTAPKDGAVGPTTFGVALVAEAYDSDGTIAKVEFFADGTKLGEATTTPWYFFWGAPPVGSHGLTALASDNDGAVAQAGLVRITIVPAPPAGAAFGFEADEGFAVGQSLGMGGWVTGGGVEITSVDAQSGNQSVIVQPPQNGFGQNTAYLVVNQPDNNQSVRYFDFWIKPATAGVSSSFKTPVGASIRFQREGNYAALVAYYFAEEGEQWWTSSRRVAVDDQGAATEWHQVTLRQDLRYGTMDIYLDGSPAIFDVYYRTGGNRFDLVGSTEGPTYLDTFQVLAVNPLFSDWDEDGMDDAWEAAHELDPRSWDRLGDRDRDTLTNVQEYVLGTDPGRSDSDGDGLPDDWELAHGFDPLLTAAGDLLISDGDGDGLTLLEEGMFGTDHQNADTDGDGVNDRLEARAEWSPVQFDPDVDGDGISNEAEIANGTDPVDYYNGQQPVITSLGAPEDALVADQYLAVQVTTATGEPFVNAPVTFKADTPDHGFSAVLDAKHANARKSVRVRTDSAGVARVYVVRSDELLESLP